MHCHFRVLRSVFYIKTLLLYFFCSYQVAFAAKPAPTAKVAGVTGFSAVWPTVGAIQFNSSLCVGLKSATLYRVTITGSGSGGSFKLQNNSSDSMNYFVEWANQSGQTAGQLVTSGLPITGLSSSANVNCKSTNTSLIVKITETELQSANSGTHTGIITVLVSPE